MYIFPILPTVIKSIKGLGMGSGNNALYMLIGGLRIETVIILFAGLSIQLHQQDVSLMQQFLEDFAVYLLQSNAVII